MEYVVGFASQQRFLTKRHVQFLKTFNVKLLKEKPSSFTVKGGIGFWSDIWVEIKRRELAT